MPLPVLELAQHIMGAKKDIPAAWFFNLDPGGANLKEWISLCCDPVYKRGNKEEISFEVRRDTLIQPLALFCFPSFLPSFSTS